MKAIKLFLLTYIFALSLVPCSDGGEGLLDIARQVLGVQLDYNSNHSDDCEDDMCSPFCICSCCSSTLKMPVEIVLIDEGQEAAASNIYPKEDMLHSSSFVYSIWQPPRFC